MTPPCGWSAPSGRGYSLCDPGSYPREVIGQFVSDRCLVASKSRWSNAIIDCELTRHNIPSAGECPRAGTVPAAPSATVRPRQTQYGLNVYLLLGQRRRRWANLKPTLGQRIVFVGTLSGQFMKVNGQVNPCAAMARLNKVYYYYYYY